MHCQCRDRGMYLGTPLSSPEIAMRIGFDAGIRVRSAADARSCKSHAPATINAYKVMKYNRKTGRSRVYKHMNPSHFEAVSLGELRGAHYLPSRQGAGQPRLSLRKQGSDEESPGSTRRGWRVTPAVGNHRESATESIPPMASSEDQARVKGCGKSAPGFW